MGSLFVARSQDGGARFSVEPVNHSVSGARVFPAKPIHWPINVALAEEAARKSSFQDVQGHYADVYHGVPEVAASEELLVVPFVHRDQGGLVPDQLMVARASWDLGTKTIKSRVRKGPLAAGKPIRVDLRIVNKHSVPVYEDEETVDLVLAGAGAPQTALQFVAGQASVTLSPKAAFGASLVWSQGETALAKAQEILPANTNGSYQRAISERQLLMIQTVLPEKTATPGGSFYYYGEREPPSGDIGFYPVEYRVDLETLTHTKQFGRLQKSGQAVQESGVLRDAQYLAAFGRVWAYTLGIALSQASRGTDVPDLIRAQGLARVLCDKAVLDADHPDELKGWHFSWNTKGDSWKDARLVTGASAWAVHGLGVFLSSDAFQALKVDKLWFQRCYERSLRGLLRHRRRVLGPGGDHFYLMTAGWTTEGLRRVDAPPYPSHPIGTAPGAGRIGSILLLQCARCRRVRRLQQNSGKTPACRSLHARRGVYRPTAQRR